MPSGEAASKKIKSGGLGFTFSQNLDGSNFKLCLVLYLTNSFSNLQNSRVKKTLGERYDCVLSYEQPIGSYLSRH